MAASSLISELRDSLSDESARIQRDFEAFGDGRAAVAQRTRLVEDILARLWRDIISPDQTKPVNFALVATGGFGRGWLFPYSDIDLLFLFGDRFAEQAFKDPIRRFSQELWDLRLKLSPASRTLSECDRYDANNTEFTISLLDCRYLSGDHDLFRRLHDKVIPKVVMRESKALLQGLAEVTRERHAKYGMTLYHLEPNLKEAPGGLRDCNVASWLALISAMDKLHDWPDASSLRAPVRSRTVYPIRRASPKGRRAIPCFCRSTTRPLQSRLSKSTPIRSLPSSSSRIRATWDSCCRNVVIYNACANSARATVRC